MKKIREAWPNRTLERGSENAEVGRCYLRYSEFGHGDGSLFRPRHCPVTDSIPTELLANKLSSGTGEGLSWLGDADILRSQNTILIINKLLCK